MGMDLRCVLLIPADRYLRGAQRCAHSMAVPRCCMSRGAEALQQIQPMGGCAWLGVAVQGCFLGGLVCVPSFSRPAASAEGCCPGVCEALNALCSISSVKHYLLLLFFCFLFFFIVKVGQVVLAFQAPDSWFNCRPRSPWQLQQAFVMAVPWAGFKLGAAGAAAAEGVLRGLGWRAAGLWGCAEG